MFAYTPCVESTDHISHMFAYTPLYVFPKWGQEKHKQNIVYVKKVLTIFGDWNNAELIVLFLVSAKGVGAGLVAQAMAELLLDHQWSL